MENKIKQSFYGKIVINGETFMTNNQEEYNKVVEKLNDGKSLSEILKSNDKIEDKATQKELTTKEYLEYIFDKYPKYPDSNINNFMEVPLDDICNYFTYKVHKLVGKDTILTCDYDYTYVKSLPYSATAIKEFLKLLYNEQKNVNYKNILRLEVYNKYIESENIYDDLMESKFEDVDKVYGFGFEMVFKTEDDLKQFLEFINTHRKHEKE